MEFQTTNKLDFEACPWEHAVKLGLAEQWMRFRIGTCEGVWCATDKSYDILGIHNTNPGNGHLNDVFEWFERSAKRDGKALRVLEVWNTHLKRHLLTKRGFIDLHWEDTVIKYINNAFAVSYQLQPVRNVGGII